jgi:hypothetical protein
VERKNCWEVMGCGREPNGGNVGESGVCPAAVHNEFDGVNKGKHGGRFCWAVTGTLCSGEVEGTCVRKLKNCLGCEFLKQVSNEESPFFILLPADARKTS